MKIKDKTFLYGVILTGFTLIFDSNNATLIGATLTITQLLGIVLIIVGIVRFFKKDPIKEEKTSV